MVGVMTCQQKSPYSPEEIETVRALLFLSGIKYIYLNFSFHGDGIIVEYQPPKSLAYTSEGSFFASS